MTKQRCPTYRDSAVHQIDVLTTMTMFTFIALMISFDSILFSFGAILSLITGRIAIEKVRPSCACKESHR